MADTDRDIKQSPPHGGCLLMLLIGAAGIRGVWLIIITLGVAAGTNLPLIVSVGLPIVYIVQIGCILGIYQWKKWGVQGFVFLVFFEAILSLGLDNSVWGLCIPSVSMYTMLYLLIRPNWQYYEGENWVAVDFLFPSPK